MKIMVKVVLSVVMVGILVLPVLSDSWYNLRMPGDETYVVGLDYDGDPGTNPYIKTTIKPTDVVNQFHCDSWLYDGESEYFRHQTFQNGEATWREEAGMNIDGLHWYQDVDIHGTQPTTAQVEFWLHFPA